MVEREGRGRRALLMDDDPMVGDATRQMLGFLGYHADVTRDGADALALFDTALADGVPYDVVVLDLTVAEGMGGLETADELHRRHPDVRLVVLSGFANDPVMLDPASHGFDGALAKPFLLADLGQVLRGVLGG